MTETPAPAAPADNPIVAAVAPGYRFEGPALELGGLMLDADNLSDVHIRIPLGMLNRHGLVAGATGTGKTKTLQLIAEQLSANGVPVFAADVKGDLSGISAPGVENDKIKARAASGLTSRATVTISSPAGCSSFRRACHTGRSKRHPHQDAQATSNTFWPRRELRANGFPR